MDSRLEPLAHLSTRADRSRARVRVRLARHAERSAARVPATRASVRRPAAPRPSRGSRTIGAESLQLALFPAREGYRPRASAA